MKWALIALNALQQLPAIMQVVEQILPGPGKSADKHAAASGEMTKYEGALALDQRVKLAKAALINAQVEYLNAMSAAEAEAARLGIPVNAQPAPLAPQIAGAGAGAVAATTQPTT